MMSHHHSHGTGCCHSSEIESPTNLGVLYTLYNKIDLENVQCLNEVIQNSGKSVFKSWDDRLNKEFVKFVESDTDEELIFNIPFTGYVKLKSIIIIGGEDNSHPSCIKIFKNKGFMTFDDVSVEPDQEFELTRDTDGTLEYPLKIVKFSSVYNLTFHFPKNFGSDNTKIYYIGLRGEFTATQRDSVVLASYELAANPCDHKVKEKKTMNFDVC